MILLIFCIVFSILFFFYLGKTFIADKSCKRDYIGLDAYLRNLVIVIATGVITILLWLFYIMKYHG